MYLVDTNVFSELQKRRRHPAVVRWFGEKRAEVLYLSTVTIGELERGAELQRRRNPGYAEMLVAWINHAIAGYGERILPVNTAIARHWGRLSARLGNSGADLMIAATALEHSFTVVTRNIRHFAPTGVDVENPFAG